MADTPEGKMKKKVDAVLKELGVWYFAPQAGIYGKSGIPDRIGILPGGRCFGIEVKAEGAKRGLTPLQEKTLGQMQDAGAYVAVVASDRDIMEMRAALKAYIRLGI